MISMLGYEYTHYADVKYGAVIHFLIENGIVTKCYSPEIRFNRKVEGQGIFTAKSELRKRHLTNYVSLKDIETDKAI